MKIGRESGERRENVESREIDEERIEGVRGYLAKPCATDHSSYLGGELVSGYTSYVISHIPHNLH